MEIAENTFVSLSYDLSVGTKEEKELMEQATKEQPLQFVYGAGMMLDSFEEKLKGLNPGDKFEFILSPEEAYGQYEEERVLELPKTMFEVDGKFDEENVVEGATLPMRDAEGNQLNGSVLELREDIVLMDFNHPLAGETLYFQGEVVDVRVPSAEELSSVPGKCPKCGADKKETCSCEKEGSCGGGNCGCGNETCNCARGDE